MSPRVIMRVVSTSGQAPERYKETAFSCEPSDTLLDMFRELGLADCVPISCLLLPHAAAPDTEGIARTELNATLGEIQTKSLDLGLQRFNVFILTEGAAARVHTSRAVHGHRASRPNALEAGSLRQEKISRASECIIVASLTGSDFRTSGPLRGPPWVHPQLLPPTARPQTHQENTAWSQCCRDMANNAADRPKRLSQEPVV